MLPYARMTAGRAREACGVIAAAALLTVVLTWPIVTSPGRYGRTDTGDGQWSLWVVSWVAHALTTNPAGLYDANAFHPHRNALAFSEPNIGAGVIAAPVWAATKNPYAAYNWVVFVGFVVSATSAYVLARYLTGSVAGAACAAIAFAFCPFVFARFAHIQLLFVGGLPLSAWAMHRFVDAPAARPAIGLGLALAGQGLFCGYYGVAAGLFVGAGITWFAVSRGHWRRPGYWLLAGLAAAIAILVIAPFLLPLVALQRGSGFARSLEDNSRWAADWRAWLASAAWAHRWMLGLLGTWKEVLFPGFLPLGLAAAGLVLGRRSTPAGAGVVGSPRGTASRMPRDVTLFYLAIALLTFWATFGPALGLYTVFYYTLPLFSLLRAPGRFGILVTLAVAVLAARGVALVLGRGPARFRRIAAVALPALLAIELAQVPLRFPLNPTTPHPVYRLLSGLPPGPLVELPFYDQSVDYYRHARYMLNSTWHWQRLVNGYSDYIPPDFRTAAPRIATFPSAEAFATLEPMGVRYVLLHARLLPPAEVASLDERLAVHAAHLRPLYRKDLVWLYEITDWPR